MLEVNFKSFVPYEPEDISVVIPHRDDFAKRWKWFWPQYKASVPKAVLKNTVVVIHKRSETPCETDSCCKFIIYEEKVHSMIKPTLLGLKQIRTRIIARITDDADLSREWVPKALEIFNQEPHLKILSTVTWGGPDPSQVTGLKLYDYPWMKKLLHHGKFEGMEFVFPVLCLANRSIWESYYAEIIEHTLHGLEDVIFTLLSRADGIPVVNFGDYVKSRGATNRDMIQ